MNDWLKYLEQQNAHIKNNQVVHFGNKDAETRAAVTDTVICELSNMGLVSATGEEAQSFLQNQFSNDVNQVTDTQSQLNSYCTPKGRVITLFRLFKFDNQFFLHMPSERVDATLKRLQMFVMRSKVTLSDISDDYVTFGLAGEKAVSILQSVDLDAPKADNLCSHTENTLVVRITGTTPRFLVLTDLENAKLLWEKLQQKATPCNHTVWSWFDIQSGIPQVYEPNVEAFVPQMLNLHSINGVSFQKGCYPGQEVVARMHFLGKLKRRMYITNLQQFKPPKPGDLLFTENDTSEQGVGRIVDAQASPNGGFDALAVLQIASVDNSSIHIGNPKGVKLIFQELPYEVELERETSK